MTKVSSGSQTPEYCRWCRQEFPLSAMSLAKCYRAEREMPPTWPLRILRGQNGPAVEFRPASHSPSNGPETERMRARAGVGLGIRLKGSHGSLAVPRFLRIALVHPESLLYLSLPPVCRPTTTRTARNSNPGVAKEMGAAANDSIISHRFVKRQKQRSLIARRHGIAIRHSAPIKQHHAHYSAAQYPCAAL